MKSDIRKTNKCFDHAFCSWDCKPRITGLVHDPVEESEAYLSIETELEEKLRSYFSDKKIDSGSWFRTPVSCFEYWQVMKHFLWEDYRIEWRSPVELNPSYSRMIFRGYLGYEWLYLAWIGAAPKEEAASGCERRRRGHQPPFSLWYFGVRVYICLIFFINNLKA